MLLDFSSVLAEGSGKDLKMMSDLGWMTIVKRCFGAACCVGMVVLMDLKVHQAWKRRIAHKESHRLQSLESRTVGLKLVEWIDQVRAQNEVQL